MVLCSRPSVGCLHPAPGAIYLLSELTRPTFWTKYRVLVTSFALFVFLTLALGCGGGGGGGNGGGGGTLPGAPTNLVATAGNTQVSLTWNAVSGATSYNVKRSTTSGGPYTTIASFVNATNYTNTGLTNGTTYYYVVSALNNLGQGGNSNQASATPSGGGGGGGPSWLPANTIFYSATDDVDPSVTNIRSMDPDGTNDSVFQAVPSAFQTVTPNTFVNNQLVFAYTTTPGSAGATYSLYRNTTVSLSGAVKLTDAGTFAFTQVGRILFTPDGQKILFTATLGSAHSLYSLNSDGTNLQTLASADDASLSPDGSTIVISQLQGSQADLFTLPVSGGALTPLLVTSDQDEIQPQWSKDGTMVTFSSKPAAVATDPYDVYYLTLSDPNNPVKITANGDSNFSPTFSANDDQIAYARISFTDPSLNGIYVSSLTPGSESSITLNPAVGTGVYWTSNAGRSVGSASVSLGRSLRNFKGI